LLADHLNGGFCEIAAAGLVVDFFWHNGDYIKIVRFGNRKIEPRCRSGRTGGTEKGGNGFGPLDPEGKNARA
jgi:hypothetical protein